MPTGICKLCQNNAELKDSHFLPKAIYGHIRESSGETHMSASPDKFIQTSRQVKQYLLCADCEGRLNKEGENWVLKNYAKAPNDFPILKNLSKVVPIKQSRDDKYYQCSGDVDANRIGYFAVSVFWRAAVSDWQSPLGKIIKLDFGPYLEKFRLYLLGSAGFPKEAALSALVTPSYSPPDFTLYPSWLPRSNLPFHRYGFYIPGLLFTLGIGKKIIPEMVEECAIHNGVLHVSPEAIRIARSTFRRLRSA
jgi:hypothetical protein